MKIGKLILVTAYSMVMNNAITCMENDAPIYHIPSVYAQSSSHGSQYQSLLIQTTETKSEQAAHEVEYANIQTRYVKEALSSITFAIPEKVTAQRCQASDHITNWTATYSPESYNRMVWFLHQYKKIDCLYNVKIPYTSYTMHTLLGDYRPHITSAWLLSAIALAASKFVPFISTPAQKIFNMTSVPFFMQALGQHVGAIATAYDHLSLDSTFAREANQGAYKLNSNTCTLTYTPLKEMAYQTTSEKDENSFWTKWWPWRYAKIV